MSNVKLWLKITAAIVYLVLLIVLHSLSNIFTTKSNETTTTTKSIEQLQQKSFKISKTYIKKTLNSLSNLFISRSNETTTTTKESKSYIKEKLLKLRSNSYGTHRATTANKSVIHTFIDSSEKYVEEEFIQFWIKAWRDAGFKIKILTPKDAERHPNYKEYDEALIKANVCCLPRQTYLRHIAMSTVETGGIFSEPYVFPLRKNIQSAVIDDDEYEEFKSIEQKFEETAVPMDDSYPYGGNFTAWDGIFGSMMSGSQQEWNRVTQLLMKNIEKNVVLSLQKLYKDSPNVFHHENLVSSAHLLFSNDQFHSDLCKAFDEFPTIRFHPSEMFQSGIEVDDKLSVISSWFKLHKARCWGDRPVIFTFFEPVSYLVDEMPEDLLELWKTSWIESGWEPVVLNTGDAKRHPNYKNLIKILDNSLQFRNGRDRYNYFCYLRWMAVAASGGGWISDYDTFPINLTPNHTLPNNGAFTGHAKFIPNLLSGTASEFNRMVNLLYSKLSNHNTNELYSDLFASQDLFENDKAFEGYIGTAQLHDFFEDEIANPNTKWRRIDPYDLRKKCILAKKYIAIHFSHWSCDKMWFCRDGSHKDEDGNHIKRPRRRKIAEKWLDSWKMQCRE